MKVIEGNLLSDVSEGVIIHGCNTTNSPAGGFAGFCFEAYPEARLAHMAYTESGNSLDEPYVPFPGLLGSFSYARVSDKLVVANGYTQIHPGAGSLSYPAIRAFSKSIVNCIELGLFKGIAPKVYLPKIGAGIAGGDWNIISKIFEEEFDGKVDAYVYVLKEGA